MLLDHKITRILGTFEQKILKMNSENKSIKNWLPVVGSAKLKPHSNSVFKQWTVKRAQFVIYSN